MRDLTRFYIDGEWILPDGRKTLEVINPATEKPCARISLGTAEDVDAAVAAARRAFARYSETAREERIDLLSRIVASYQKHYADLAVAIMEEMGAPVTLAQRAQAPSGLGHFQTMLEILKTYPFEEQRGGHDILKEPVGVVGMITPWNWPANQIACKVAPALAAGCAMVLKPSEVAPVSAHVIAKILEEAGVPRGVFNLVDGLGPEVGAAIAAHPDVDMVSFTGSTRAGVEVARAAAPTVKRVAQELGGKSPNIILEDADLEKAVRHGVVACMTNSGQSCNAPTRMLVQEKLLDKAAAIAKATAEGLKVGDPSAEETALGPVASEAQWCKVQALIEKGVAEGAPVVAGGSGRPDGLDRGYYVKPTVFAPVSNDMTIAREEIFGPVLSIIPYKDEDEAVAIANDTPYGLSAYVYGGSTESAWRVARRLRAGQVHVNGANVDFTAPFGGYKQSGNGREWGVSGLEEYLETKAVLRPRG